MLTSQLLTSTQSAPNPRPTSSISPSRTLLAPYDPRTNLHNPSPAANQKFRAKLGLAAAGLGIARIGHIGDSITNGNTVDKLTQSYPARVRAAFTAAGYLSGGTGLAVGAFDTRWSFGAGWSVYTATKFVYQCTTTNGVATFTSDVAGTTAKVYYRNSNAFTVSIDGGTAVGVAANATGTLKVYTVTGLANTTHTIAITATSSFCYILGAEVVGATGLEIANFGLSGSTAADWVVSDYDGPLQSLLAWAPDFVTVMLGTNDERGGVYKPAQYKSNMTRLVASLQGAGCDVVLLAPPPNDAGLTRFQPYLDALYDVAVQAKVPLLDLHDRWQSWAKQNSLGVMSEATHPNAAGYQQIASAVLAALLERI